MKGDRRTLLIRTRFPDELVDRLDRLVERLRLQGRRKIPRAALIRALVVLHLRKEQDRGPDIKEALGADPVKRGREGWRDRDPQTRAPRGGPGLRGS